MKLYIYTCRPKEVFEGDLFCSLRLTTDKKWHDAQSEYLFLGEIEVEIDVNEKQLRQHAIKLIDEEIESVTKDFTAGMEQLKARKAELLALPAGVEQ